MTNEQIPPSDPQSNDASAAGAPQQPTPGEAPQQPGYTAPEQPAPGYQYPQQPGYQQAQPGYQYPQQPGYQQPQQPPQYVAPAGYAPKSRVAAGVLGILLGGLGIHRFYLGYTGIGLTMLLVSVLSLGFLAWAIAIWGLVEGILILTRSPSFATDARGVPLSD